MSDWSFLRPYEDWPPRVIAGNPFPLACRLLPASSPTEIAASWPFGAPAEVRSLWSTYGGGELFKDAKFGQCGLRIFSPAASARETLRYQNIQPGRTLDTDLILGEFLGDSDLLIVDASGSVHISLPIDERQKWHREQSLSSFLHKYVAVHGEKYWESRGRN